MLEICWWYKFQDKYCHKSEPHWEYVEWGEKDTAENLACPPSQK